MTFRRGVKTRLPLAEVDVPSYLRNVLGVERYSMRGDECVFSCPLPFGLHRHGDRSASAALNVVKLMFNCFVCGGGDIVWLTQTVLDISRDAAIQVLNEHGSFVEQLRHLFSKPESSTRPMPTYSMRVIDSWATVVPYLTERGVSEEVQRSMKIGLNRMYRETVDDELVEQPRVIIPHFWHGVCVGWQARKMPDGVGPKYRSSPAFPKSVTLYNGDGVEPNHPVIVVESPMSVLVLMSYGFKNVVATFGASVNPGQLSLLSDFDEVVLWFDGDYAGHNAMLKVARVLEKLTKVWVVDMGLDGRDPGDLDESTCSAMYQSRVPSFFVQGGGKDVIREMGSRKGSSGVR